MYMKKLYDWKDNIVPSILSNFSTINIKEIKGFSNVQELM